MDTVLTTAVRVGSVWTKGGRVAIVVDTDNGYATMRAVVAGRMTGRRSRVDCRHGTPRGYRFRTQTPTLRCRSNADAAAALEYLRGQGVAEAGFTAGVWLVVPLTPPSVLRFAKEVLEREWADDADCARMIGDLG